MKVLIKMKGSELFLTAASGWTEKPEAARVFACFVDAMDFCHQYRLANVEIFYFFTDPDFNFVVALPKSSRARR